MNRTQFLTLTAIILTAAFSRLIPHPPNVTPVLAMALFGGAYLENRRLAFLIPFAAMLASDIILGFHRTMPFVYLAFAVTVFLGLWIKQKPGSFRTLTAALGGSFFFFCFTNFGVWVFGHGTQSYPMTFAGLLACYSAAIPFFRSMLVGNLVYTLIFFGGFALLRARFPTLKLALNSARN